MLPFDVASAVSVTGGLTGPPPQTGSRTPGGGAGGEHSTVTEPVNPLIEVRVNGIVPPLVVSVVLLAERVKLGGGGRCAGVGSDGYGES